MIRSNPIFNLRYILGVILSFWRADGFIFCGDKKVRCFIIDSLLNNAILFRSPFRSRDAVTTYEHILEGINSVDFPITMSDAVESMVRRLCRWETLSIIRNNGSLIYKGFILSDGLSIYVIAWSLGLSTRQAFSLAASRLTAPTSHEPLEWGSHTFLSLLLK